MQVSLPGKGLVVYEDCMCLVTLIVLRIRFRLGLFNLMVCKIKMSAAPMQLINSVESNRVNSGDKIRREERIT